MMNMSFYFLSLLSFLIVIYNYTVPIGDGNDTIIIYYDEPIDDDNKKSKHHIITEKEWQEMEEADEREHAKEAKEWYGNDD